VLDLILERVRRLSVLLIVTFRPEFHHAWGGQPHVTTMVLNRLGERDGATLWVPPQVLDWWDTHSENVRETPNE
jgi:predicted ATPase